MMIINCDRACTIIIVQLLQVAQTNIHTKLIFYNQTQIIFSSIFVSLYSYSLKSQLTIAQDLHCLSIFSQQTSQFRDDLSTVVKLSPTLLRTIKLGSHLNPTVVIPTTISIIFSIFFIYFFISFLFSFSIFFVFHTTYFLFLLIYLL